MSVHQFPGRWQIDVAGNVRAEVARRQATQTDIATVLGENQAWISRRITGAVEWRVQELVAIAEYLGIHPAVLMGGRPPLSGPPVGPTGPGVDEVTGQYDDGVTSRYSDYGQDGVIELFPAFRTAA